MLGDDQVGEVLRGALEEKRAPVPPFAEVMEAYERRARPRPRPTRSVVLAAASAAACLVAVAVAKRWDFSDCGMAGAKWIAAENLAERATERPDKDQDPSVEDRANPDGKDDARRVNQPELAARPLSTKRRESSGVLDCARLGTEQPEAAIRCYTARSRGSGVAAESAYLELARLHREAGHDPEAALRSVEEYEQRFPGGALKPEASLAKIDLLVQLGRNAEARKAIRTTEDELPSKAESLRELALDLAVADDDCETAGKLLEKIPAERATPTWKAAHLRGCADEEPSFHRR